jgi:hypothetical protein
VAKQAAMGAPSLPKPITEIVESMRLLREALV